MIFISNSTPEYNEGPSLSLPSITRPKKKDARRASPITQYSRAAVSIPQMEAIPMSLVADACAKTNGCRDRNAHACVRTRAEPDHDSICGAEFA